MRERMSKGRIDSGQMKLGEILVARSLITRNQLQSALEQQKTSGKGGSVRFKVRGNSQGAGHTPPAEAGLTGADPRTRSDVPRAWASGPRHILKLGAQRDGSSEGFAATGSSAGSLRGSPTISYRAPSREGAGWRSQG